MINHAKQIYLSAIPIERKIFLKKHDRIVQLEIQYDDRLILKTITEKEILMREFYRVPCQATENRRLVRIAGFGATKRRKREHVEFRLPPVTVFTYTDRRSP